MRRNHWVCLQYSVTLFQIPYPSQLHEYHQSYTCKGEKLEKGREDATVITAKRNDDEAVYSGYYKTKGWKKEGCEIAKNQVKTPDFLLWLKHF